MGASRGGLCDSKAFLFMFVIINGSKHVQTRVKSWSSFYKVVQLHKPCGGGLTIYPRLQISYSVYVPKIIKIGWQ